MGVILSWSVMYIRLFIICSLLCPSIMMTLAIPMLVPMIPGLMYAAYLKYKEDKTRNVASSTFTNPFELMPAIKFGLIFTAVLLVANYREFLGMKAF